MLESILSSEEDSIIKIGAFRIAIFERHLIHIYIDVFDNILWKNVGTLLLLTIFSRPMLMALDEKFFAHFFSGFQALLNEFVGN